MLDAVNFEERAAPMFDRISLRKKIVLLSLVPALVACIVFGALTGWSAHKTSKLVHDEILSFMETRTARSLTHGHASAEVAWDFAMEQLKLRMQIAKMDLASRGGVEQTGAPVAHTLVGNEEDPGGEVHMAPLHFGGDTVVAGRSDRVEQIHADAGALVVLFERVPGTSEMVRVSSNSPAVQLNTFLSSTTNLQSVSPAKLLSGGDSYSGRTLEAGEWHVGLYEPLRDHAGTVVGALYLGIPVSGFKSLQEELMANSVGDGGSVVLVYGRGPQAGTMIGQPKLIAAATESKWLPDVLTNMKNMKDGDERALNVYSPEYGTDAVVRYSYVQHFGWVLVSVSNAGELTKSTTVVREEFSRLIWTSLGSALLVLIAVAVVSTLISKRIVNPLLEITIQLTSNGTQVASSVNQQLSHATSFNASSTEIATAVREISSTSQELLRAMEELSQEASGASMVAHDGSSSLRGMGESIEGLSRATNSIAGSLDAIKSQASKINAVTLAVTKVADQTNLLSLNAAIEAERAGEAGAGFAVVAREIRRLADQSAHASQEIEQTVHEMQDAVAGSAAELRQLTNAVSESVKVSEHIREQFGEIIQRVESMTPRYERVHLGMQNQSVGAQQISDAMWQLTESSSQTTEAINELNQVSLELHRAVSVLKERVFEEEAEQAG